MLLPFAIVAVVIFIIVSLWLVFRKSSGKEINKHPEVSGNEKKIEKPASGKTIRK